MLEAMEEIQVSPTIQLKRVGPEDLGTGGQVVRVHLPDRFRVLLDSVAAPVNAPPQNLSPHTPVEQDRLPTGKFSFYGLIGHPLSPLRPQSVAPIICETKPASGP